MRLEYWRDVSRPYHYHLVAFAYLLLIGIPWCRQLIWPPQVPPAHVHAQVQKPRAAKPPSAEALQAAAAADCLGWSDEVVGLVANQFTGESATLSEAESNMMFYPVVISADAKECTYQTPGPLMGPEVPSMLWFGLPDKAGKIEPYFLIEQGTLEDGSRQFAGNILKKKE